MCQGKRQRGITGVGTGGGGGGLGQLELKMGLRGEFEGWPWEDSTF